jgi:hypothetical protein
VKTFIWIVLIELDDFSELQGLDMRICWGFEGNSQKDFFDSCDCLAAELICRIYPHARLIDWSFAAAHDEVRVYSRQRRNPFARIASSQAGAEQAGWAQVGLQQIQREPE